MSWFFVDDPDSATYVRGLLVTFLTKNPILKHICWLLHTKRTNAVPIANEDISAVATCSLPGVCSHVH